LATELTSGVGFFHVRGLDPQRYSNEMNVVLYLGISTYIGGKRGRQDELGNMLRESLVKNDFHGINLCLRRDGGLEKLTQKKMQFTCQTWDLQRLLRMSVKHLTLT